MEQRGLTTGFGIKEPGVESQLHHLKSPSLSFPICQMGVIPALQGCCEDRPHRAWHTGTAESESALRSSGLWGQGSSGLSTRPETLPLTSWPEDFFKEMALLQTMGRSFLPSGTCSRPQRNFSEKAQIKKEAADSGAKQQPCEGVGSLQGHGSHCLEQKGEGLQEGLGPGHHLCARGHLATRPPLEYAWRAAWGRSLAMEEGKKWKSFL